MARLMIFVDRPRQISLEEGEAWLENELEAIGGDGIERVRLKRVLGAAHFSPSSSWIVQLDCRDVESARSAVREGPCMALLGDLSLLGMRPSVALVEDAD